ncbi:hypothetical protein SFRURICE_013689 [Spodoptera frugiperda]|nr:hypothetical protein SFRURICE_013689 [Spodoptera frugiperda]
MTSQIYCIAHMKFAGELTRIENANEQQWGRKPARHDHLAWSEDPPFLRELYSLKLLKANPPLTSVTGDHHGIQCIVNPNEPQLDRKPARHDHLAWSEDPPFLRALYSLFPKY